MWEKGEYIQRARPVNTNTFLCVCGSDSCGQRLYVFELSVHQSHSHEGDFTGTP